MRRAPRPTAHLLSTGLALWLACGTASAQTIAEPPQPTRGRLTLAAAARSPMQFVDEGGARSASAAHVDGRPAKPSAKVFVPFYSGLVATQVLDIHSTLRAIDGGSREANPAMRHVASNAAMFIGVKAATTTATILAVERLRRRHPKPALFVLVGINAASAFIVAHNYQAR